MKVRAYCLISGGLDSVLALKLLQREGIETVGVHFRSAFFDKSAFIKKIASSLGFELKIVDISAEHFELVKNPSYGYGKNLNPCIDCHALMLRKTAELLEDGKPEFVATGEVFNQRPMSQNKNSLLRVEIYSGLKDRLLRPLSAKLLPPTLPERSGWVNRENLLDLYGKNRKPQFNLAKEWEIEHFETPAGGCKLTDTTFASRLIQLKEKNLLHSLDLAKATNSGRILEISPGHPVIISRNEKEGEALKAIPANWMLCGFKTMGPTLIGWHQPSENEISLAAQIFSYYSKAKGKIPASALFNDRLLEIPPLDINFISEWIQNRLIV